MSRIDVDEFLARSGDLLACAQCHVELTAESASGDFCSESCQRTWGADRVGAVASLDWPDLSEYLGRLIDTTQFYGLPARPPLALARPIPPRLSSESIRASLLEVMSVVQQQFRAMTDAMSTAVAEGSRMIGVMGLVRKQLPVDPMQRALELRRNRNTGPAPRRLDGRRQR